MTAETVAALILDTKASLDGVTCTFEDFILGRLLVVDQFTEENTSDLMARIKTLSSCIVNEY